MLSILRGQCRRPSTPNHRAPTCVIPYDDLDHAIAIANGTSYGLAAAVWGADDTTAANFARSLRAGQIDINGAPFNPAAPFGGFKNSGFGRELGEYGIREFLEPTSLQYPERGPTPDQP